MLNHTKKIKEIYEEIQRKLLYMIPEKWDTLYLYSSIIDINEKETTGELFFYYIPKGIFRKSPVNVYEIPAKFNIDENEYLQLVDTLYNDIKEIRKEFQKSETREMWSNITISISNMKFRAEYNYEDLLHNAFNSYERHVIWRYEYLGIGPEQVSKKEKEILYRYFNGAKSLHEREEYNAGIYIDQDIKNIVEYNIQLENENNEYIFEEDLDNMKISKKYNQINSHKIENNWDSRRKKKETTMWSKSDFLPQKDSHMNKKEISKMNVSENKKEVKTIGIKNQILFSKDEDEE